MKVTTLSNKSTWVLFEEEDIRDCNAEDVLRECCERLGLSQTGTEQLVCGSDVVAATTPVADLPGLQPAGHVSQYQLIVRAEQLTCDVS
eukprot:5246063-Amphidinium_carterae.1